MRRCGWGSFDSAVLYRFCRKCKVPGMEVLPIRTDPKPQVSRSIGDFAPTTTPRVTETAERDHPKR
jgi:hypothetical protein